MNEQKSVEGEDSSKEQHGGLEHAAETQQLLLKPVAQDPPPRPQLSKHQSLERLATWQ